MRISLIQSFPQVSDGEVVIWDGMLLDLTDQFPELETHGWREQ